MGLGPGKKRQDETAPRNVHRHVRLGLVSSLHQRMRFHGTVRRMGKTRGRRAWMRRTVLLTDIVACEDQSIRTDHVWLVVGKQLENLQLHRGDKIQFDARVRWYRKRGGHDLKLSHHTKLKKCM